MGTIHLTTTQSLLLMSKTQKVRMPNQLKTTRIVAPWIKTGRERKVCQRFLCSVLDGARIEYMNTHNQMKRLFVMLTMGMLLCVSTSAQTRQTIFSFTNSPSSPYGNLVEGPDGNFYGTTFYGGRN